MAVNSQFLFFYIDELIKHHWVDWLEGPFSEIPPVEHQNLRGFQGLIGDTGAGPRTRAGEAYNLGILSGRIVRPQVAGASFPSGWQSVIDGKVPSTKLGYYSYVVGKALRENPGDPNLERALDCLASIFILHIAFQANGRWYNTALLFQFAYNQLEAAVGRKPTSVELRYLSAAVINTLDSSELELVLAPYGSDSAIGNLRFDMNDGKVVHFSLNDLPEIVASSGIGINDFKKTKAALFWANPTRGIFTRAAGSQGGRVIQELLKVDRKLAETGQENLLSETLQQISNNEDTQGIFTVAENVFTDWPDLLREWQDLEGELFAATNKAAEAVELKDSPLIWSEAQLQIRNAESHSEGGQDLGTPSTNRGFAPAPVMETDAKPDAPVTKVPMAKSATKNIEFPSIAEIEAYLDQELVEIEEAPPKPSKLASATAKVGTARITKTNFAEKEARNRRLGEAGEQFVYLYEVRRLKAAGKEELSKRVAWVSKEIGDGLGYDIKSFEADGNEIFLEVKTTASGRATPFFVSNNEVVVSNEKGPAYRLVRVFNFSKKPRLFTLSGSLSDTLELEATSYRARII